MNQFVSMIEAKVSLMADGLGLIIHATAGDAHWFWDGGMFCIGHGVPL